MNLELLMGAIRYRVLHNILTRARYSAANIEKEKDYDHCTVKPSCSHLPLEHYRQCPRRVPRTGPGSFAKHHSPLLEETLGAGTAEPVNDGCVLFMLQ